MREGCRGGQATRRGALGLNVGDPPPTLPARGKGKGKAAGLPLAILREVYVGRGRGNNPLTDPLTKAVLPAKAPGGPEIKVESGKDPREELFNWMRSPENPFFARSSSRATPSFTMYKGNGTSALVGSVAFAAITLAALEVAGDFRAKPSASSSAAANRVCGVCAAAISASSALQTAAARSRPSTYPSRRTDEA